MSRRFLAVTVGLTATVAFLIGLIVAGSMTPQRAVSAPRVPVVPAHPHNPAAVLPAVVSFAGLAAQLKPAVVKIDATSRGCGPLRRPSALPLPDGPHQF